MVQKSSNLISLFCFFSFFTFIVRWWNHHQIRNEFIWIVAWAFNLGIWIKPFLPACSRKCIAVHLQNYQIGSLGQKVKYKSLMKK